MRHRTTREIILIGVLGVMTTLGSSAERPTPNVPTKAPEKALLLDSFDANDWIVEGAPGTKFAITTQVQGKVNQALKLTYTFNEPRQWIQIHKGITFDSLQGKAIQLYLKGTGKANALEFKLVDGDGTNFGARVFGVGNMSDWRSIVLDEADFSYWHGGDPKLDKVQQIYLAVTSEQAGSGEFFSDELQLVPSSRKVIQVGMVDACESAEGWMAEAAEGGKVQVYVVPGKNGKAIFLGYDVPAGQWAQLAKKVQLVLTPSSTLTFWAKGDGTDNDLEVKVVDADGTNFGKKLKGVLKQKEWQEIRIPYKELTYWYGGDATLDPEHIRALYLAVSGKGGKGALAIDEIALMP